MKNKTLLVPLAFFCLLCLWACKKEAGSAKQESWRGKLVTGTWKQKDLVLSVSVKLGSTTLPAGSSMITLAPTLAAALKNPALGTGLTCTKNNTYTFNTDSSFAINGCTDLILPKVGASGKWSLTVYDAVLNFRGASGTDDPHWINSITSSTMQLSVILAIPGVGNLPLGLILEK